MYAVVLEAGSVSSRGPFLGVCDRVHEVSVCSTSIAIFISPDSENPLIHRIWGLNDTSAVYVLKRSFYQCSFFAFLRFMVSWVSVDAMRAVSG